MYVSSENNRSRVRSVHYGGFNTSGHKVHSPTLYRRQTPSSRILSLPLMNHSSEMCFMGSSASSTRLRRSTCLQRVALICSTEKSRCSISDRWIAQYRCLQQVSNLIKSLQPWHGRRRPWHSGSRGIINTFQCQHPGTSGIKNLQAQNSSLHHLPPTLIRDCIWFVVAGPT